MPKLTGELYGAPEGEVHPRTFAAGDDCPPSLEDAARALGLLDEPRTTKARKAAPENKAQ